MQPPASFTYNDKHLHVNTFQAYNTHENFISHVIFACRLYFT